MRSLRGTVIPCLTSLTVIIQVLLGCLMCTVDPWTTWVWLHGCTYTQTFLAVHTIVLWSSWVVLVVKNPIANVRDVRDTGLSSGLGRSFGAELGNPLQYSCLKNHMDRGVWQATAHWVIKSRTWLNKQQHYSTTPSSDMEEPQIWRADYKLYPDFQLCRESVPLTLNWSAVFKEGGVTSSR